MLVENSDGTFWHPAYEWGWGMMAMHGFGWILILIVVIALVVVLSRGWAGPTGTPPARRSALEILEERYAHGEVDRDEYLEKRKDLH